MTTNEKAELLASALVLDVRLHEVTEEYQVRFILERIPLTELIAVAEAAIKMHPPFHPSYCTCIKCEATKSLRAALTALRAKLPKGVEL